MNYRIKVEGSRKVLVVHHNRLKPRRGDQDARSIDAETFGTSPEDAEAAVAADPGGEDQTRDTAMRDSVVDSSNAWSPSPEVHFPLAPGVQLRRSTRITRRPDFFVP